MIHSLPFRSLGDNRVCQFLTPYPQRIRANGKSTALLGAKFQVVASHNLSEQKCWFLSELSKIWNVPLALNEDSNAFIVSIKIEDNDRKPESYHLSIQTDSATITGQDAVGLFYGMQTFLQLVGFCQQSIPLVEIFDWPSFPVRSVMLDLGRGVYSKKLIQRCIRIMARLKLNSLHLHLYDDQLSGIRLNNLPIGHENPGALSIAELTEIIAYAREFHISVCPEMESWGHVGSLLYHFPECYGAPGMWEGSSLGIGEKSFQLLTGIYEEIIPALETKSMIHLGLDEAKWSLLPEAEKDKDLNPEWLISHLHDLVTKIGNQNNKQLTVCLWADHGGRPIPKHLRKEVIVQPWAYFELQGKEIREKVKRYSETEETRFIMGAGQSSVHFNGTYGATRTWCQEGSKASNCMGVNLCLWESNTLDKHLVTIFGGSDFAWNARKGYSPPSLKADPFREISQAQVGSRMLSWQSIFEDGNEANILADRGDAVFRGYYISGSKSGQPVAPTVTQMEGNRTDNVTA
ncbi:family 20 glycosylhydrolase [Rubellicoccus peritrichatus]|uniref:beta-N-acetylhexosaminidase n=1 Tax=Rubellicoccus peritrichatus TaxID=3080537 RepID=A0AAQ3L9Y0_9BACT|nr:family 20 glycosylhydrolase [Puniceicoccus sp. CR14]WOO41546.1 family 20 glycosylhydrolase [Puniceicoccus sp. CR14]